MPESEKPMKRQDEEWITVNGRKILVRRDETREEAIRQALPSKGGEKQKNTKQALSKGYEERPFLEKSLFNPRDEVVFDKYKKSGVVAGMNGDSIKILYHNNIISTLKNSVFKKSELIDGIHWDTMTFEDRAICIEKAGIDPSNVNKNWMQIQPNIRAIIQKTNSPAGYESGSSGIGNPIYNPISENKTVSQRMKEEESKQHEKKTTD